MLALADSLIAAVQELLSQGKSTREVSRLTGVSRSSVNNISRGILPGKKKAEAERRAVEKERQKSLPRVINPNSQEFDHLNVIEFVRCPTCGGKVQKEKPCLACTQKREVFAMSNDCYYRELLEQVEPSAWPIGGKK